MFELTERTACLPGRDADDRPGLRGFGCDEFGKFKEEVLRAGRMDRDAGVTAERWGDYALAKGVAGAQIILCRLMGRKVCVKLETI